MQPDFDPDATWREACDVQRHVSWLRGGEWDGQPPVEDWHPHQARFDQLTESLADEMDVSYEGIRAQIREAVVDHRLSRGAEGDPDFFAPPDWDEMRQSRGLSL